VEDYRQQLEARGVLCQVLDKQGDDPSRPGLRLATMHRVKGLEFDHVLVVGVNAGVMPLDYVLGQAADEVTREEIELAERALLYVAATRARRSVLVTSFGAPSALLPGAGGRLLAL
jgi:superfamily I DNA/RNA helicase